MRISVNGEPLEVAEASTVQALLLSLELGQARVAVERNKRIVPTGDRALEQLAEGDSLEIVTFVGGG